MDKTAPIQQFASNIAYLKEHFTPSTDIGGEPKKTTFNQKVGELEAHEKAQAEKIEKLSADIFSKDKELEILKATEQGKQVEQKTKELEELRTQLKTKEEQHKKSTEELSKQIDELMQGKQQLNQEIEQQRTAAAEVNQKNEGLQNENTGLTQKLEEAQKKGEEIAQLKQELENQTTAHKENQKQLTGQVEKLEKELQEANENVETQKLEITSLKQLSAESEERERKTKAEMKKLQIQLNVALMDLKAVNKRLDAEELKNPGAESVQANEKKLLEARKAELELAENKKAEESRLAAELLQMRTEEAWGDAKKVPSAELEKAIEDAQREAGRLDGELKQPKLEAAQKTGLENQLVAAKAKLAMLQAMQAAYNGAKDAYAVGTQGVLEQIGAAHTAKQEELTGLGNRSEENGNAFDKLQAEVKALGEQKAQLEALLSGDLKVDTAKQAADTKTLEAIKRLVPGKEGQELVAELQKQVQALAALEKFILEKYTGENKSLPRLEMLKTMEGWRQEYIDFLKDLGSKVGAPPRSVQQVINGVIGVAFEEMKYRLELAQKLTPESIATLKEEVDGRVRKASQEAQTLEKGKDETKKVIAQEKVRFAKVTGQFLDALSTKPAVQPQKRSTKPAVQPQKREKSGPGETIGWSIDWAVGGFIRAIWNVITTVLGGVLSVVSYPFRSSKGGDN